MAAEPEKKDKRRAALMAIVEERGYITLSEVAAALGVSAQTIRRDMTELEKLGRVKRTHGGITFTGALDQRAWHQRQRSQTVEKKVIAEQIADLVTDGATVFLDIGTTCEEVAVALLARRNLKIVTYSIRSAAIFDNREDFTVAIPGGIVRHIDGAILGAGGDDFISQFRFDYAILAVSGIDMHGTLRDDDEFEVLRVRTAMAHARQILLALTTDKIGTGGLVKLCDLGEIDVVVTNDQLPSPILSIAMENNVEVIPVSPLDPMGGSAHK
ncbi:DeoR/GlpR family DNA-binding transcription regulator [Oceaniglobus ichthyenteri]|uniref:DeoR/GlpR family DNA-binding transcription regulator n=1 Tax=Oceaniglobus ichthyenteri TaxID=2136177 RepID=UPI000D37B9D6|nr:DeoR/GlpR family DNA-binding transcription regulator [Oceaniglobus ichthyenteri]